MAEVERLKRCMVYQNKWMKVHEDQVRFRDGTEGGYGVVEKPDFALIVPQHQDGRFQLVQQFRYPVGARFWEFPQGAWETRPEASPDELALAELEEETGYRAGSLKRLGYLSEAYGYSSQGCHVFLATDLEKGILNREPEEQGMETGEFLLSQIKQMIRSGQITDAATIAALTLYSFDSDV